MAGHHGVSSRGTAVGTPLVEARGLGVVLAGRRVLSDVTLAIHAGEIVTVIGLNGSGKTTLVRTLLGLQAPSSGTLSRKPGLRIGYTPQHLQRDPTLPLTVRRFLSLGAKASRRDMIETLEAVGAADRFEAQLATLSGGEMHRVALARALLRKPELLVLDEPVGAVDLAGRADLYGLIARLREERGFGVLLVSHDLHVVMARSDHVICLDTHICCEGDPGTVAASDAFKTLFGPMAGAELAVYRHSHDLPHEHPVHQDTEGSA